MWSPVSNRLEDHICTSASSFVAVGLRPTVVLSLSLSLSVFYQFQLLSTKFIKVQVINRATHFWLVRKKSQLFGNILRVFDQNLFIYYHILGFLIKVCSFISNILGFWSKFVHLLATFRDFRSKLFIFWGSTSNVGLKVKHFQFLCKKICNIFGFLSKFVHFFGFEIEFLKISA